MLSSVTTGVNISTDPAARLACDYDWLTDVRVSVPLDTPSVIS